MATTFRPEPRQVDLPVEHRRPLMPSELADSRLFPGWGPRV
jgi:hypothetical protein